MRIDPITPRRLTTREPVKIPMAPISSNVEYVCAPVVETWYAIASTAGRLIGIKNAANVLIAKCGRASTTAHERRNAPDTEVLIDPPPRFGMPRMITAPRTKVMASAMNNVLIDPGNLLRIAAATPKPIAPPT